MEFETTDLLLTGMLNYGAPILGLVLLLGGMGIPLPGTLMVLLAGAFVRQGLLDGFSTMGIGLACVIIGDCISYGMGYYARNWVNRHFGRSKSWQSAQEAFQKRGGVAIYLTRFLITPLAVPTNLIAGSTYYPFRRFLMYDLAGEFTWLLLFGSLGYAFGTQWDAINSCIRDSSGLMAGLALVLVGIYFLRRHHNHAKLVKA
ncbi:DedA family protein [Leucothrix mucor]|uniref:DedA family protein n=1 Tax=Leucothrix mucor TaxID=45248 RepID=UPI0003B6D624|nr:DedA family protein [Leucothrix mucor]